MLVYPQISHYRLNVLVSPAGQADNDYFVFIKRWRKLDRLSNRMRGFKRWSIANRRRPAR
jgi:hypothetical protein